MSIISTDLTQAIKLLTDEQIVAIPTETVYGLSGNIYSQKAIKAIFETKKRPFFNPLIVHVASLEDLYTIVETVPKKALLLAEAFWPGPLTLVLKKKNTIPNLITAGKDTVAVRVPNHPLTLELLKQLPFPLAAPSANPFGSISPTSAAHVERYFKDSIKMVLDGGKCTSGIESTIVGFENNQPIIHRLGSTSQEAIEAVVGAVEVKNKSDISPAAPGMLERHYAPKTSTILAENISEAVSHFPNKRIGLIVFQSPIKNTSVLSQIILSKQGNMAEAASKLYEAMHQLDSQNLDLIIAEKLPDFGLGKSINDRLSRATK